MEIMRKKCARFHFACLILLIFPAKLFKFINTRGSATYYNTVYLEYLSDIFNALCQEMRFLLQ